MTRARGPFALALVAVGACFGGAEVPAPSPYTVLGAPDGQQPCDGTWRYVGSLAVGFGGRFAIEPPYEGPQCDGGPPGMIPQFTGAVLRFGGSGDPAAGDSVGDLGTVDGSVHPAVGAAAAGVAWVVGSTDQVTLTLWDGSAAVPHPVAVPGHGPPLDPAGVVRAGGATWLALRAPANFSEVLDFATPTYPCCGPSLLGSAFVDGTLVRVDDATHDAAFIHGATYPASVPDPVVADGSDVYFARRPGTGDIAELDRVPTAGSGSGDVVAVTVLDGSVHEAVPSGLAAANGLVAWATTIDPLVAPGGRGCTITVFPRTQTTASAPVAPLLSTGAFSCAGLALDETAVYFAIVHLDADTNALRGDGIGRVTLADHQLSTLAIPLAGPYAGPRRVYVDGTDLLAVDPIAVGRIPKAALDGHHDL